MFDQYQNMVQRHFKQIFKGFQVSNSVKGYNYINKTFSSWVKSIDIEPIFNNSLAFLGLLFVITASPSIAKLKQLEEFYFVKKHGFL